MSLISLVSLICQAEDMVTLNFQSDATLPPDRQQARDTTRLRVHPVQSKYQSGETKIRVLLPDRIEVGRKYPVLYVLPVEAGEGVHWGDSIAEIRQHNLQNKYGLICVFPTFSALPWYADHPTNTRLSQETYFVQVVVPFVERTYPAIPDKEGRLLVGFSKSGWGAWSLLLRHPEFFGRAAAWDAPLMLNKPDRYGMKPIFGTQANFERYQVSTLLKQRHDLFSSSNRLILLGYGNFRDQHQQVHSLMQKLSIVHTYRDGPKRRHAWDSDWLPEAVEQLVRSAQFR